MTDPNQPGQAWPHPPPQPPMQPTPTPPKPAKKPLGWIVAAAVIGAFVLLAGLGGARYVAYRTIGADHCDSVGAAATAFTESAFTFEPGVDKDAYLARNRDKLTPAAYNKLEQAALPIFEMREKDPALRNSTTRTTVIHRSVSQCTKESATVVSTVNNWADRTIAGTTPVMSRSVLDIELRWMNRKWLVDRFNPVY